ncbi:MAG: dienelactone hydrolase family protein, partial [Myxococcaceae bacterium]
LATLLFDLLTVDEEREDELTAQWRFDMDLLAERLIHVTDWSQVFPEALGLPVGLFGSSTGAAAAMMVAAERPELIRAVVSRGGRLDLGERQLGRVQAPSLLIVGECDEEAVAINERALRRLSGERRLVVIPGATHLFEEIGALEQVSRHAAEWLVRYLAQPEAAAPAQE